MAPARQAGIAHSVVTAASVASVRVLRKKIGRTSAVPDRRRLLATPHKCIIQISGFQHPKPANVLLGLSERLVGDEHLTIIRMRPQSPRAAGGGEAGNENPDTGGDDLPLKR